MRAFLMLCLAAVLAGCAGYKLGPTNGIPAGSRSIEVRPFVNKTKEPRVTEYMAMSLRQQLQRDGTYQLETSGHGDILVTGAIVNFTRNGLSYQTNDVLTPQEYTLVLTVHITAVNVNTGKTALNRDVFGTTYMRIGNDQSSSERQAIPQLTDDLARRAVALLVDGDF